MRNMNPKPLAWLRACQAERWPHCTEPMPKLAALTGQDTRALEAIAACWRLYASSDDDGAQGALTAVRALLPALQPQCHPFARELIAWAMEWSDRARLWPVVTSDRALVTMRCSITGESHQEVLCGACVKRLGPFNYMACADADLMCGACGDGKG